jgi:hypothetical protein
VRVPDPAPQGKHHRTHSTRCIAANPPCVPCRRWASVTATASNPRSPPPTWGPPRARSVVPPVPLLTGGVVHAYADAGVPWGLLIRGVAMAWRGHINGGRHA